MQNVLFHLATTQLTVYKRTITIRLFISEWDGRRDWLQTTADHDVVWSIWVWDMLWSRGVYQRVRWATRLASDYSSWARRRLKHLSLRYAVIELSWEISRADWCIFGLSSWPRTRRSTAAHQTPSATAWLKGNCTRHTDSFEYTFDAAKFSLVGKFNKTPLCTTPLDR